ncbi:MAG: YdiU family protein [Nitrosomonas sp.]|nr:MAG: YdiU family protein [Nitrosomonas sp.]
MNAKLNAATSDLGWHFDNSYTRLPDFLFVTLNPVPVRAPQLIVLNHKLAGLLGLETKKLSKTEAAMLFSGSKLPDAAQPIAQAYAGHQFGHFTMLGDGRALLIGEHITPAGKRFDVQLKGSGQTKFSRRGDGRAALGPMLREYIISEAMSALGIPTTRSLAVVTTGEAIMRETLLPGAILTRVAASHIRVGTFEYAAGLGNTEGIKTLADYTISRHYPDLFDSDNRYLAFLQGVIERQASLIAKWMLVGFIHGVMNTDNMAISGETIDYGPCAFMDAYDNNTVFSSIDYHGRYRFRNQPHIAQWNLARLAETLLPLIDAKSDKAIGLAEQAINTFPELFQKHWLTGMRRKLGLFTEEAADVQLIEDLLAWMQKHRADYTNSFRALISPTLPADELFHGAEFVAWFTNWKARLVRQSGLEESSLSIMQANNPVIIPRNHRVEAALAAATHNDYSLFHQLLAAVTNPFDNAPKYHQFTTPPLPSECVHQTFCGT